jgi:DNA-binding response OmpR family regulator
MPTECGAMDRATGAQANGWTQAPVIFYTGSAREHDHKRALRAGATAYYVKPVAPDALCVQVNILLERAAIENLLARIDEERAVQDELTRSAAVLAHRAESARKAAANAIERTARLKAWKAFVHSGGLRALVAAGVRQREYASFCR